MRDLLTQLPTWVGVACIIAGTAILTWTAAWLHQQQRADAAINTVADDRDQLLEASIHLLAACRDPQLSLDRAVTDLEKAIDGRWTA